MIAGIMTIRYPDGRTESRTVNSVLQDPELYKLISAQAISNPQSAYPDNAWTRTFDRSRKAIPDYNPSSESEPVAERAPEAKHLHEFVPDPASKPEASPPQDLPAAEAPNIPAAVTTPENPSAADRSSRQTSTPAPQERPFHPDEPETRQPSTPAEQPPSNPRQPAAPAERHENGPIQGSVLFMGDSISVNMDCQKEITSTGAKMAVAAGGETSKWLLRWIEGREHNHKDPNKGESIELQDPGLVKNFDTVVMLIGTNDIGANDGPDWSAEAIFGRIEKIWLTLKKINPNIKINAVTIPPFKGYKYMRYGKDFAVINKRRKDINQMILKSGIPTAVIDICRKYDTNNPGSGGVATSDNPDEAAMDERAKSDMVHPKPAVLAQIYQEALSSGRDDRRDNSAAPPKNTDQVLPAPNFNPPPESENPANASNDLYQIPANSPILNDPSQIQKASTLDPLEGKGRVNDPDHPVPDKVPAGFVRSAKVSSKAVTYVNNVLKDWRHTPINTTIHFETADHREYMARIEWHANPAEKSELLRNPHHGWSVFPKTGQNEINN